MFLVQKIVENDRVRGVYHIGDPPLLPSLTLRAGHQVNTAGAEPKDAGVRKLGGEDKAAEKTGCCGGS